MRKIRLLALVGLMALALSACGPIHIGQEVLLEGSGNITTQHHQVGDFTRIDMSGVGDVEITQGETASLAVEADDNLQAALRSEVRERLDATVSGMGNVEYLGSPEVHQQLRGSGTVRQRALTR